MKQNDPSTNAALATAVRLLAQAAEAQAMGKRYHDAGLAMLAHIGGSLDLECGGANLVRLAKFKAACKERSVRVTADEYIAEPAAADLLAVARTTLATWRQEGRVPFRRTPGGNIQYGLADLAEFVGSFSED